MKQVSIPSMELKLSSCDEISSNLSTKFHLKFSANFQRSKSLKQGSQSFPFWKRSVLVSRWILEGPLAPELLLFENWGRVRELNLKLSDIKNKRIQWDRRQIINYLFRYPIPKNDDGFIKPIYCGPFKSAKYNS